MTPAEHISTRSGTSPRRTSTVANCRLLVVVFRPRFPRFLLSALLPEPRGSGWCWVQWCWMRPPPWLVAARAARSSPSDAPICSTYYEAIAIRYGETRFPARVARSGRDPDRRRARRRRWRCSGASICACSRRIGRSGSRRRRLVHDLGVEVVVMRCRRWQAPAPSCRRRCGSIRLPSSSSGRRGSPITSPAMTCRRERW